MTDSKNPCPHFVEEHIILAGGPKDIVMRRCRNCGQEKQFPACSRCNGTGRLAAINHREDRWIECYCLLCEGKGYE